MNDKIELIHYAIMRMRIQSCARTTHVHMQNWWLLNMTQWRDELFRYNLFTCTCMACTRQFVCNATANRTPIDNGNVICDWKILIRSFIFPLFHSPVGTTTPMSNYLYSENKHIRAYVIWCFGVRWWWPTTVSPMLACQWSEYTQNCRSLSDGIHKK